MTFDPTPVLDPTSLARLRQLDALKPGIIAKLVDSFVTNQARFIDEVPNLAAAGDFQVLRVRVHALKGAAASLGALHLAATAHSMEHAAASDRPAQALTTLTALRAQFELACAALVAWAASPG